MNTITNLAREFKKLIKLSNIVLSNGRAEKLTKSTRTLQSNFGTYLHGQDYKQKHGMYNTTPCYAVLLYYVIDSSMSIQGQVC